MHILDDDLYRYASWLTSESQEAEITSHLSTCGHCRDTLISRIFVQRAPPSEEVDGGTDHADRRRDRRIRFHERATLTRLNPLLPERLEVHVLNLSAGGLKLHTPARLDPGTVVQLRLRLGLLTAEVRYCLPAGAEFHVGVSLSDVFLMPLPRPEERRPPPAAFKKGA